MTQIASSCNSLAEIDLDWEEPLPISFIFHAILAWKLPYSQVRLLAHCREFQNDMGLY